MKELMEPQIQSFGPSLDDVFRQSETLWKKKHPLDERVVELQANMLLGEHGFSLSSVPSSSAGEFNFREEATGTPPLISREVTHESIALNTDKVKLDAERAFLNQYTADMGVVTSSKQPALESSFLNSSSQSERNALFGAATAYYPDMDSEFAKALSKYVANKKSDDLSKGFMKAALKSGDDATKSLWEQGVTLLTLSVPENGHVTPRVLRSSVEWIDCLVEGSLSYLQKNFMLHMMELVQQNLRITAADISNKLTLVDAYLKVKHLHATRRICQDGVYGANRHAVWEVIYHCLRVGDYKSVAEIARSHIHKLPSCVALAAALSSITKTNRLSMEDRDKLRAEWRAEFNTIVDVYKKAVYCALLGGDVPEICDCFESWLWLKLAPYFFDTAVSPVAFTKLQRTIAFEYGEDYFNGKGIDQSFLFEALWLSGQFERAIHALCKSNKLTHAVHLAILAYVNNLLVTSPVEAAKLCEKDSLECSLNLSRIVLMYVKPFECTHVARALDYYFILRHFQTPIGSNMFYACVSRAAYLSGETFKILGEVDGNGMRGEGFIDKYSNDINVNDAIVKTAADAELSNDAIKAVRLYHVAERYDDAMRSMCNCLADALKEKRFTGEALHLAVWLAGLYKGMAEERFSSLWLTTLCLLIDLSTFFYNFSEKKYSICMEIVAKVKCIPLEESEVGSFVSVFQMVPVQVRSVLPDLCLAVMDILAIQVGAHPDCKEELALKADAIVTYVARIPQQFPVEVNRKILELNARIHRSLVIP
ncbi:unnamed protein product [Toxocara canis]|uniref:Nuclear pore protein n=1 Tax=Toxocara canis TaxID=6265 RepID=A0A183UFI7_TOXCA|nr:unnamed protein product [Toxocara canis]